jgi:hypothetical protein
LQPLAVGYEQRGTAMPAKVGYLVIDAADPESLAPFFLR